MLKIILTALLLIATALPQINAACNVCIENNGVACISKNEFHICVDGRPNTTTTFRCQLPTEICTKFGPVCRDASQSDTLTPECGDTSKCCKCGGVNSGSFTCTSRTTFAMCSEDAMTAVRGSCPKEYMCDVNSAAEGSPCVLECSMSADAGICDLSTPCSGDENIPPGESTTTTTRPPTNADAECATHTQAGRYKIPNDSTCTLYASCYWEGNKLVGVQRTCPTGKYFNANISNCQDQKPAGCA